MPKSRLAVPVLLSCVLAAVGAGATIAQEVREPTGLLAVEQISSYEVKLRPWHDREGLVLRRFNRGRPYAISINAHLPDARASRAGLARLLDEGRQSHKVVSEWFGTDMPKRLNLLIGSEVPVEIAQAALAAYAVGSKLPVHAALEDEDGQFGGTRRIYIGGLVDLGGTLMPPDRIGELLKPGLTREEFARLLPKSSGRR